MRFEKKKRGRKLILMSDLETLARTYGLIGLPRAGVRGLRIRISHCSLASRTTTTRETSRTVEGEPKQIELSRSNTNRASRPFKPPVIDSVRENAGLWFRRRKEVNSTSNKIPRT